MVDFLVIIYQKTENYGMFLQNDDFISQYLYLYHIKFFIQHGRPTD